MLHIICMIMYHISKIYTYKLIYLLFIFNHIILSFKIFYNCLFFQDIHKLSYKMTFYKIKFENYILSKKFNL
jgi:hypothetical protein